MNNLQTPPPLPSYIRRMSIGTKILLLGLQCGILMIGALIVWVITYSRDELNKGVSDQIANEWGGSVFIKGPLIKNDIDSTAWLRPTVFNCNASVSTKSLHRNIYEAEVFDAGIEFSGTFNKDSLAALSDTLFIQLNLDTKQLVKLQPLKISGKSYEWQRTPDYLFVSFDIGEMPQTIDFSSDFNIRGSSSLFISQVGCRSFITFEGEAHNPSFSGSSLPNDRSVTDGEFSARWENYASDSVSRISEVKSAEVYFLVGVDRYQKVSRSLKYAFIIIVLTYVSVLFSEIIVKHNIPLLNYFLIGVALIIFYILLLSFSEYLRFGIAYFIASLMTISLITGYMWRMLHSAKVALVIGSILTILYLSCYILLSLSNYALLLGSLLLFISLAAMMFASLKLKF